jgi:hypothetical protein
MPAGDVEAFHPDGKWWNRIEGEKGSTGPHNTKAEAQTAGRHEARHRGREHIIRDEDGRIAERNSHGNDPNNVHG